MKLGKSKVDAPRYTWPELRGAFGGDAPQTDELEVAYFNAAAAKMPPNLPEAANRLLTDLASSLVPEAAIEWWMESVGIVWVTTFWASLMLEWDDLDHARVVEIARRRCGESFIDNDKALGVALTAFDDAELRSYLDAEGTSWQTMSRLKPAMIRAGTSPLPPALREHGDIDDRFDQMHADDKESWLALLESCFEIGRAAALPCVVGALAGVPTYA